MTDHKINELIRMAQEGDHKVCVWGCGYIGKYPGRKLLNELGIHIDYYCDNNSDLWGREVADGIRCLSIDQVRRDHAIVFVLVSEMTIKEICIQLQQMGVSKIVTYVDICKVSYQTFFPFLNRNQIAVYTCVVDGYDVVEEPISVSSQCDYYIISDKRLERKSVFQYIDINDCIPESIRDNTRKNRYCKINAHKIFPQYRYSVYMDGNVRLKENIVEKISELPKTRIMARARSNWDNVYCEAFRRIIAERDKKDLLMKQAETYWLQGMPENFGSVACGILVREHNHPVCRRLMEEWWDQVELFSNRDQISFPYVLWKNGYEMKDVGTVNGDELFSEKYMIFEKDHAKPRSGVKP